MTQTTFTITDADKGKIIGPPDGFLVDLKRTAQVNGSYEIVDSLPTGQYKSGRLQLRASGEVRDLICLDIQGGCGTWASFGGGGNAGVYVNSSIGYLGSLEVVCVPKGSTWEVVLSDVPVTRTPINFNDWIASVQTRRERELVGVGR